MENDKLPIESENIAETNKVKLSELFPSIVKDGEVDYNLLKSLLGDSNIENDKEHYSFTWNGKSQAIFHAQQSTTSTLIPDIEHNEKVENQNSQNIYIEGDNLEVLKILRKSYFNKIKMIYIDPPYNTENDFIYPDNYSMPLNNYLKITGQISEDGHITSTNQDKAGRKHTIWLNMMYPRLMLAKDLLTDDGAIFISIDDIELNNLTKICNEIFGEENFIANIIRNTNSSKNQSLFVSVSHEYCLIYAKNMTALKNKHEDNKWQVPKNNIKEYIDKVKYLKNKGLTNDEITDELKELTKYPRFIDFTNYWYFDERGLYSKGDLGGVNNGNMEPIINPITKKTDPVPPGGFRFNTEKLNELIKENRIHFHTDGSLPRLKRYLQENLNQRPKSIMSDDQRPDNSLLQEFNTPFDNPKQLAFIKRIISVMDKDSIILDFFSGSSTTAHAIMQLNAEDNGNRKYIMVQLPELIKEKEVAYKEGYRNICQIGRKRIELAGEKIREDLAKKNAEKAESLDIGYKCFKLAKSNFKEYNITQDNIKNELNSQDIIETFIQQAIPENIVYEIILALRLPLTCKIEQEKFENNTLYIVENGVLIICLDNNGIINDNIVKYIKDIKNRYKPEVMQIVLKDNGIEDQSAKINIKNALKDVGITHNYFYTV